MRKKGGDVIVSMIAVRNEVAADMQQERSPWEALSVLASFRSCTAGHAVLMGRDTLTSIGALGRSTRAVVVESNRVGAACDLPTLTEALVCLEDEEEEVFICGDGEFFDEALPLCQKICLILLRGPEGAGALTWALPGGFVAVGREELPHGTPPVTLTVFEKVARMEPNADREELCRKGSEALQRRLFFLARQCFEQAQSLGDSAELASDLALCRAKSGGDLRTALAAAADALRREPDNLRCLLNLGRLQLLAGHRDEGMATLRQGVQTGGGPEFLAELERSSPRSPPPIGSLPRNHPLNRYLGRLLRGKWGRVLTAAGAPAAESTLATPSLRD